MALPPPMLGISPNRFSLTVPRLSGNIVEGSFSVVRAQKASGGYTVYQIVFKVRDNSNESYPIVLECEVWKRYKDLQLLSRQLETLHQLAKSLVGFPFLIKASYLDRFKEAVIEERRKSVEVLLRFASRQPHLINTEPLLNFLTAAQAIAILPAELESVNCVDMGEVEKPPPYEEYEGEGEGEGEDGAMLSIHSNVNVGHHPALELAEFERPDTEMDAREESDAVDLLNQLPDISLADNSPPNGAPFLDGEGDATLIDLEGEGRAPLIDLEGQGDAPLIDLEGEGCDGDATLVDPDYSESDSDGEGSEAEAMESGGRPVPLMARDDSVEVTEWDVAHSLQLQEEEPPSVSELSSRLARISEAEDSLEAGLPSARGQPSLNQTPVEGGRGGVDVPPRTRSDSDSESSGSPAFTLDELNLSSDDPPGAQGADISPKSQSLAPPPSSSTLSEEGAGHKNSAVGGATKSPDDSLSSLTFDTVVAKPAPSTTASSGRDWWSHAMEETQDLSDLDTLVDSGATGPRGGSPSGAEPMRPSDTSSVGRPFTASSEEGRTAGLSLGLSSPPPPPDSRPHRAVSHGGDSPGTARSGSRSPRKGGSRSGSRSGSRAGSFTDSHSRSPSPSLRRHQRRGSPSVSDGDAYVIQAGRLISQGLEFEKGGEYKEAFDLMKAAVDLLLNGVQSDRSKRRREVVRRKTAVYLQHAELLYQKHILAQQVRGQVEATQEPLEATQETLEATQEPVASAPPPTSTPHRLPDFRVLGTIDKVILVASKHTGQTYIFKVLYKSLAAINSTSRGRVTRTKNRSPARCPHMVRLLHHYETGSHRIFLLLEHITGSLLVDFVRTKREQWEKLKQAAANPPPSLLLGHARQSPQLLAAEHGSPSQRTQEEERSSVGTRPGGTDVAGAADSSQREDEEYMERMLNELTDIVPPSSLPVDSSLTSGASCEEEEEDSLDSLALMRQRLEETIREAKSAEMEAALRRDQPVAPPVDHDKEGVGSRGGEGAGSRQDGSAPCDSSGVTTSTLINVQPPTPTAAGLAPLVPRTNIDPTGAPKKYDAASPSNETIASPIPRQAMESHTTSSSPSSASPRAKTGLGGEARGSAASSGRNTPCFAPGSLRASPEGRGREMDGWERRLEGSVRQWAAQIVLALESLHAHGVICRDINPKNILLDSSGKAVLTYFGKWDHVERKENHRSLYVAPELHGLSIATPEADWWSLGAILFEILTGKSLLDCNPGGLHAHIPLRIPTLLSPEAQSLLQQLLQVNPNERLGAGMAGVEGLKSHPFFSGVDWSTV